MKKFLFALLAIMGISASCTSSYEEWYLTVSDQSGNYIISAEGQTNTIVLTTTSSVDLSCSEDWVHLARRVTMSRRTASAMSCIPRLRLMRIPLARFVRQLYILTTVARRNCRWYILRRQIRVSKILRGKIKKC